MATKNYPQEELVNHLTQSIGQPIMQDNGSFAQNHRELEAYNAWVKKDHRTRIILLSSMNDDLIGEYYKYSSAK